VTPYKPLHHPSITKKRKTTMASKDDNKRKYVNGIGEEAEEALPKNQKTIGDDNSDGDDSSSTNDYSLEPEDEVSSEEEEMNLLAGSEEELLIQWGCFDDGDTSNLEKNDSNENGGETSNDGDTSDDEEE
jgi:hypothetical protein